MQSHLQGVVQVPPAAAAAVGGAAGLPAVQRQGACGVMNSR